MIIALIAFFGSALFLLLKDCKQKDWACQFPFLAACVSLGWLGPQIVVIYSRQELPAGILANYLLMTALCLAAIALGDWLGGRQAIPESDERIENEVHAGLERAQLAFLILAFAGVISGLAGWFWLSSKAIVPSETLCLIAFMILMLAVNLKYALGLAWVSLLKDRTRTTIAIVAIATGSYLLAIVVLGRRAMAADLLFAILLSFWFIRRQTIPKWLVVGVVCLGTAWVGSAKAMRGLFLGRAQHFADGVLQPGDGECKNGALVQWDVQSRGAYDYGFKGIQRLLYGHFPGQPLGGQVRESLFPTVEYAPRRINGVELQRGVSITGPADCFQSFGYFGALVFAGVGYAMRRCYRRAVAGNLEYQFAYMFLICAALHLITHGLYTLLIALIHLLLFFVPLFHLLRAPASLPIALPARART